MPGPAPSPSTGNMILEIQNENYGYSVATATNRQSNQNYVAIGNPSSFRYYDDSGTPWTDLTQSFNNYTNRYEYFKSGSSLSGFVDLYAYNVATDQHDLIATLCKIPTIDEWLILSSELNNIPKTASIHTELGSLFSSDKDIGFDSNGFSITIEDDYGHSVDFYRNVLAVGCRWYLRKVTIPTTSFNKTVSGSCVDIYNTNNIPYNPYKNSGPYTGSLVFTSISSSMAPEETISGSFGYDVSVNDEWVAIGSPLYNERGVVHMFRRTGSYSDSTFWWNYFSTITASDARIGDEFGSTLQLNKATGSNGCGLDYSGSLIVGSHRISGSHAYYYEFISGSWREQMAFSDDLTWSNLAFADFKPIQVCSGYTSTGFGSSVAIWANTIVIGAPNDRWFYEYSGSRLYRQGAFYIVEKCDGVCDSYTNLQKIYGEGNTLKNNKMGYSVGVWDDKIMVSSPKDTSTLFTPEYIQGTLLTQNYCTNDLENTINGQWLLYTKNTSSNAWGYTNTFQKKKKYLSPYRSYGYDVDIQDGFAVVGSPMILSGSQRLIEIDTGSYLNGLIGGPARTIETLTSSLDLSGKGYIYNLNNYRDEFHVGNVFYKNGLIILNTSGSVFDGIWFNDVSPYEYEYQINFSGKQTIYEKQIVCTIEPGEFNVSTNPTSLQKNTTGIGFKQKWQIRLSGFRCIIDVYAVEKYQFYIKPNYKLEPICRYYK
jgi:hypothetical protein